MNRQQLLGASYGISLLTNFGLETPAAFPSIFVANARVCETAGEQ